MFVYVYYCALCLCVSVVCECVSVCVWFVSEQVMVVLGSFDTLYLSYCACVAHFESLCFTIPFFFSLSLFSPSLPSLSLSLSLPFFFSLPPSFPLSPPPLGVLIILTLLMLSVLLIFMLKSLVSCLRSGSFRFG